MLTDRSDVERLLRTLLPALLAVGGCDAPPVADAETVVEQPAEVVQARAPEFVQAQPQVTEEPTEVAEDPPEVTTEPPTVVKAPQRLERRPASLDPSPVADMPRATCPSGTWCTDERTARRLSSDAGEEMGCPAMVGAKPGKPLPAGFPMGIRGFDSINTTETREAGDADACCYSWVRQCPGGRPLIDTSAQPVVAPLVPGQGWDAGSFEMSASDDALRYAAQAWLADAAAEHASVASFARVSLELMALGAPPELLEGAHHAALDEIRHAKTCLSLARACGAASLQPAPLPSVPQRDADLARFAVDTFVEGCVGETTAALAINRAAGAAPHPAVRVALQGIAEDEGRHAALAWRMLKWAVATGGPRVVRALRQRASALRVHRTALGNPSLRQDPDGLAALGRLDAHEQAQAQRDAWQGIIEPMLQTLIGAPSDLS